jgi:hypothetical protein
LFGQDEVAYKVLHQAPLAVDAKVLSHKLKGYKLGKCGSKKDFELWQSFRVALMESLLWQKQLLCPEFKSRLIATYPHPLTHCVPDKFWGSPGPRNINGKDMFSLLLMQLRLKLIPPHTLDIYIFNSQVDLHQTTEQVMTTSISKTVCNINMPPTKAGVIQSAVLAVPPIKPTSIPKTVCNINMPPTKAGVIQSAVPPIKIFSCTNSPSNSYVNTVSVISPSQFEIATATTSINRGRAALFSPRAAVFNQTSCRTLHVTGKDYKYGMECSQRHVISSNLPATVNHNLFINVPVLPTPFPTYRPSTYTLPYRHNTVPNTYLNQVSKQCIPSVLSTSTLNMPVMPTKPTSFEKVTNNPIGDTGVIGCVRQVERVDLHHDLGSKDTESFTQSTFVDLDYLSSYIPCNITNLASENRFVALTPENSLTDHFEHVIETNQASATSNVTVHNKKNRHSK